MLVALPVSVGYAALFLLVGGESAGLPLPGETSLIAAAVLAAHGSLSLPLVLATAAAAAIGGDNLGYLIGRKGVRQLLLRGGRQARRARLLERGEEFFARHGAAAVFFGRWLPVLRITAAWLAGANRMPWRRFALWNALGGVAWASSIGAAAYLLGTVASHATAAIGLAMAALAALAILGQLLLCRLTRRHGLCLAGHG